MVQLKVSTIAGSAVLAAFQFHYGTIKSISNTGILGRDIISIPLWYD